MHSRLYWQLHRLAFLLEKKADESLKAQLGLGFAQYKVLEAINQNALVKQNIIAALLDQTEASISRQIKILQQKNLVVVNEVMGNKRAREISLTMQGEEMVSHAAEVLDVAFDEAVGALGYQESVILSEMFERMIVQIRSVN